MKKSIKIISALMIIAAILLASSSAFAAVNYSGMIDDVTSNAANKTIDTQATNVAGTILNYVQWAAIIGSIIVITILGIKYMTGSLEEKAAYKKTMIPLVIGCVVAVGATSIAKFLFGIF